MTNAIPLYVVYVKSNVEECFFVAALPSRVSAQDYINAIGVDPNNYFIIEQDMDDPIMDEVK